MRHERLDESVMAQDIDSPAEPLIADVWEAPAPTKRVALARKALDADPDFINAYTLPGVEAKTHGDRIERCREVVAVAERLPAPALAHQGMHFWEGIGNRLEALIYAEEAGRVWRAYKGSMTALRAAVRVARTVGRKER